MLSRAQLRVLMIVLLALLVVGGWQVTQSYWIWGYSERSWPEDASVNEPADALLPSPRRTLLFERKFSFLGGPRLLAVVVDPETDEEICRVPIREPAGGRIHWLETRRARYWGSRWSEESLEDLTR